MDDGFGRLEVSRKTGTEPFHFSGAPLGFDLLLFWQWASSDLMGNALRGIIAEYLVARALGLETGVRAEWDACDLRTPKDLRVEVKSAAYMQTWDQRGPSQISFSIAPARGWDARTNTVADTICRAADVYVFALHHHMDKPTADPLDISQWTFYVLPVTVLNERCASQKRITLSSLLRLGPAGVPFGALRATIEKYGERDIAC
jgi:hypothetical protein